MARGTIPRLEWVADVRTWNHRVFPAGVPAPDAALGALSLPAYDDTTSSYFAHNHSTIARVEFTGGGSVDLEIALVDRAAGKFLSIATSAGMANGAEIEIEHYGMECFCRLSVVTPAVADLVIAMRPGKWRF